jgi:hypothetical protein
VTVIATSHSTLSGAGAAVRGAFGDLVGRLGGAPDVLFLSASVGGKPFLGAFTFGEQGCFVGGENRHGNLMIATLVFGS